LTWLLRDSWRTWALLGALAFLNVLNFLDRQLLAAVAPRLVTELHLTNTQLGVLVGFAFVLFFSLATLVVGPLADRVSRTRLVAVGVVAWSLTTMATGSARGFADLVAARLLMGFGEATLVPCALALLAERFPSSRLGLASGLFWAGWPAGRVLSFAVAANLVPLLGWRACFYLVGAVGLPAAAAVLWFSDSPRSSPASEAESSSWTAVRDAFRARPALAWVIAGTVLIAFAASASSLEIAWLARERGFTPARAAQWSALVVLAAGFLGNPLVGALADRWERARPGGRARCLAAMVGALMPMGALVYVLPSASPFFVPCWLIAQVAMSGWQGASSAVIQDLAPPRARALTVAVTLLIVNLLGIGPGALVVGLIGDAWSLGAGLLIASVLGCGAAIPYLRAAQLEARNSPAGLDSTKGGA
jgi:MFS family permease